MTDTSDVSVDLLTTPVVVPDSVQVVLASPDPNRPSADLVVFLLVERAGTALAFELTADVALKVGCDMEVSARRSIQQAIGDRRAERALTRLLEREAKQAWGNLGPTSCAFCPRTVSVINDGTRYCKRHAREHGVIVHGKIV
jgi:hypothetical protein